MAHIILHKDGAYNIYSGVTDNVLYVSPLTLKQLEEAIFIEEGNKGLEELPSRLIRTHEKGCSSMIDKSLEDCISCNRAGLNEERMALDDFILKYLTFNA